MDNVNPDEKTFGQSRFENGYDYFKNYEAARAQAILSVNETALNQAVEVLADAERGKHSIFVCGNGGSTAIANHMVCDFNKGVRTGTSLRPRFHSLSSNVETLMAIANDISFDEVFAFQLDSLADKDDVLLVVSSSGNSPNVARALEAAARIGMKTIAMTGFEGGRARELAEISLHVANNNYGIVEDCHHSLMHVLAQFLRQREMDESEISKTKF